MEEPRRRLRDAIPPPLIPFSLFVAFVMTFSWGHTPEGLRFLGVFGLTLLFSALFYPVWRLLLLKKRLSRKDLLFLGFLLPFSLGTERLFIHFSHGIRELLPFGVPFQAFNFILPAAAGAMIVRLALGPELALFLALASSLLASLLLENSLFYALYFFAGSLAAVWLEVVSKVVEIG